MADSSFDIVSKIDHQEVDNALGQAAREITQRYDFKGTGAEIKWSGDQAIEISGPDGGRRPSLCSPRRDDGCLDDFPRRSGFRRARPASVVVAGAGFEPA